MEIKYLQHKHGGKITEIRAVAHETYKGVASWHFIGMVQWEENKPPRQTEIPPYAVCFDHANAEAKEEADKVFAALSKHLNTAGKWHDSKHARDGRVYSWTPKQPAAQLAV